MKFKIPELKYEEQSSYLNLFKKYYNLKNNTNKLLKHASNNSEVEITKNNFGTIIMIVPKNLKNEYKSMKESFPNDFLGFTILLDDTKNLRLSCFGIPCNKLTNIIIQK